MSFDVHNYDDIINIEKPKSSHKPMDRLQRSAQFAPFSALNGYEDSIDETGRIVEERLDLSDEEKDRISARLTFLQEHIKDRFEVEITYFVPDTKKKGGAYQTKVGVLRRVIDAERKVQFEDRTFLDIDSIIDIKADCFNEFDIG